MKKPTGRVDFHFDKNLENGALAAALAKGLSAVVRIDDTLWIANDETVSLERLTLDGPTPADSKNDLRYGHHDRFELSNLLELPVSPPVDSKGKIEEADIEGMDFDGKYLWLVGSHSLKRKKADKENDDDNIKRLADVSSDGNRFLLARIPVKREGGVVTLEKETTIGGKPIVAARLRGNANGNDITKEISEDEHLKDFLRIPGKDNGFDIEGLAVLDDTTVLVGLRGPVLRGWAVVLQLKLFETAESGKPVLRLEGITKRFVQLKGLGIRDLIVEKPGNDLLILAGPTMELDGPVTVYRWKGGADKKAKPVIANKELGLVCDIPYEDGCDHAEGMTLFGSEGLGKKPDRILVVYDAAAKTREQNPYGDLFRI